MPSRCWRPSAITGPTPHLAWVVNRGLRGLLDGHPDLDEVIPFDRSQLKFTPTGLSSLGRFLLDLRKRRFDLVIDLQGLLRSGIMAQATGAPVRVGLDSAREGSRYCYTHRIESPGPETHAVDRLLKVAEAFGADVDRPRFEVAIGPQDSAWARMVTNCLPRPLLAINVGARWLTKRWPPAPVRRRGSSRGRGTRGQLDSRRRSRRSIACRGTEGGAGLDRGARPLRAVDSPATGRARSGGRSFPLQ